MFVVQSLDNAKNAYCCKVTFWIFEIMNLFKQTLINFLSKLWEHLFIRKGLNFKDALEKPIIYVIFGHYILPAKILIMLLLKKVKRPGKYI